MLTNVNNMIDIYHIRGFALTEIKADLEFKCICTDLSPSQIIVTHPPILNLHLLLNNNITSYKQDVN